MPTADPFALVDQLRVHGQSHLLDGVADLDEPTRATWLARLAAVDWEELAHPAEPVPTAAVSASRVISLSERTQRAVALTAAGEAAYRAGAVAVLMVAGGQGTRLGTSAPKGCCAIAPHSGKSIYQVQAEKVLSLSRRIAQAVPFLIMTSPMTDAETREFFAAHADFGLADGQVRFFSQGTVPSLDQQGRALLAAPGRLLENPDGHGGCFTALVTSGNLARLAAEGVRQIVFVQVDNILAPVDDPILVGLAESEHAEVVTKVLAKAHPDEKVGHLVRVGASAGDPGGAGAQPPRNDSTWPGGAGTMALPPAQSGHDRIIEYTELSPDQCRLRGADGELIYRWGSPAMHCWSVGFLARLAQAGYKIPLHRSSKPLKAWRDGNVQEVKGWKSERFIFDLIPEARTSLGLEIDRDSEFAPVKNASGADSAATAVALAHQQYASWLAAAGVRLELPLAARIEISPLFAATRAQFLARWDRRVERLSGDYYLEG